MPVSVTITFNKQVSCTYASAPLALQICHQYSHIATAAASNESMYLLLGMQWALTISSFISRNWVLWIPAQGKSLPGDLGDLWKGREKINVYLCLLLVCDCHADTYVNVMLQFSIIKHTNYFIFLNLLNV